MTTRPALPRLGILAVLTLSTTLVGSARAQDCKLDDSILTPLLRKAFAALVSPQSNTTVGNYAALDLKDAEVTFAGAVLFERGAVLGVKLHGGISEGLLPVFSNKALNTRFGGDLQLNFLDPWQKEEELYDYDVCERYYARLKKLVADSVLKAIDDREHLAAKLIQVEIEKLDSDAATLGRRLNDPKTTQQRKDSIAVALKKIAASKLNQQQLYQKEMTILDDTRDRRLRNWYVAEEAKLADSVHLKGFTVGWFSIGYGAENVSFRLFDPALPFADQVSKRSFLSHTVRAQYSRYNYGPAKKESSYWSLGAAFALGDNLGDLSKIELTETTSFGPNPTDRVGTKKYSVFQGKYVRKLTTLTLFGDFYKFLLTDNQVALHVYPEAVFKEDERAAQNLGMGFLVAFRQQDKLTTILNAEAYIKLEDLTNRNHPGVGPFKRSSYGFRFSVPINFPSSR